MHYWIKFKKQGFQKYISHRDMLRLFNRAIRRAEIPMASSLGFNPHLLISFSPPIELGVASNAEHIALKLSEEMPVETIIKRLNAKLPEGMEMVSGARVPLKIPSLMTWIESASYRVTVSNVDLAEVAAALQKIVAAPTIIRQRRSKRAVREIDIRSWIHNVSELDQNTFTVQLQTGQNGNLKVSQFMKLLPEFGSSSEFLWSAERLELFGKNNSEFVTPLVLLKYLTERRETIGK